MKYLESDTGYFIIVSYVINLSATSYHSLPSDIFPKLRLFFSHDGRSTGYMSDEIHARHGSTK